MIKVTSKGDFKKTVKFLKDIKSSDYKHILDKYGKLGVTKLAQATPSETGRTANSWEYRIEQGRNQAKIIWYNTNFNKGVSIALLLQYGHGTGTGGYVKGIDYINPAMKPVFKELADAAWKEVVNK